MSTTQRSPQMANLMARYSVTNQKDLVRAIRDEFNLMCVDVDEEPFTLAWAENMLDQLLEAEYQRIQGGAYV